MKNIFKYSAAAALIVLGFASCEELPDYQTTIDAAPDLVYANPKDGDTFSTKVVHRPIGSEGSFLKEFQVSCNTTDHGDVTVAVVYDPDLVAEYNAKNGTSYAVLPEEYFTLENDMVTVAADTTASRDTVRIRLNEEADLSALTERGYLAPFIIRSDDMAISEQMGNLWFIVDTEVNLIRPLESVDGMVGFPAGGTALWTADCADSKYLFDGDNSTTKQFSNSETTVLTIDMKEILMVTGLKFDTYILGDVFIEYSEDGSEWKSAGTPVSGEYVWTGSQWSSGTWAAAVYDYFSARYIRLTYKMGSSYSGYYDTINDIQVYIIESTEPTVYTITGADNVVTGKVVHKKGVGSTAEFNASFNVYSTISSESGYTVTAAYDASLVDAYNQKNGTSYKVLPAENFVIEPATIDIAAGENVSAGSVALSLTGDLTVLTDENGYLAPVKLSASGAETSASRGFVYAVIKSEQNLIKDLDSVEDIIGFPASGRSSWSADVTTAENLFDSSSSTVVNFNASGNMMTVNMGGTHLVTGLDFEGYSMSNVCVEYSLDGSSWKSAGTAASSEVVFTGSTWSSGHYYIGFIEHLEAAYLRISFGFSGYYRRIAEFSIYEIESTEPTVYSVCGTDNVFTGKVTHHSIAGSIGSASCSFNVMSTIASDSGYSVDAEVDNSFVNKYNSAHGTKYAQLDPSYVEITGAPCEIAAGANKSAGQISVALAGDLSKLTNKNGYVIPVKLSASGAVTSESRGVVYLIVEVEESDALMMTGFSASDIQGTLVDDRSGWSIVTCDDGGIHSGAYENLFDGDQSSYIRTWGGPVSFTVDLGQEYDMTGLLITARSGNYSRYQPNSVQIMGSLDGSQYEDIGTAAASEGSLLQTNPTSYVAFYASKKVRYLKIEASYGSNMGTAEFNIYAK